eukprot:EC123139.1.p1 GENE.EC123139.1~~EC123139.1.p1  ORF type:complete len:150 (+),score=6.10 EC123139.1:45-494(+)
MRNKNRYLLAEVIWDDRKIDNELSANHVYIAIRNALQPNFGDIAVGRVFSSLSVKYFNNMTNLAIIRCHRDFYKPVWAAVTMLTSLKTRRCFFHVIHTGGTVKQCQRVALPLVQKSMRVFIESQRSSVNQQRAEELMALAQQDVMSVEI